LCHKQGVGKWGLGTGYCWGPRGEVKSGKRRARKKGLTKGALLKNCWSGKDSQRWVKRIKRNITTKHATQGREGGGKRFKFREKGGEGIIQQGVTVGAGKGG